MLLRKKTILSLIMSATIIAVLAGLLSLNFLEIRKETSFLEMTDTIRSKTLQLRRHEKNYFLYAPEKADDESKAIHEYLEQLTAILLVISPAHSDRTSSLKQLIRDYRGQFSAIQDLVTAVHAESSRLKRSLPAYRRVSVLIEANFLDKPLDDVAFIRQNFAIRDDHAIISLLQELDKEISLLRKTGENILNASKELDKQARYKVDRFVRISQIAIIVFFPLFLLVGFGSFLAITGSIVRRLNILSAMIEKTGKGNFDHVDESGSNDEVGQLLRKFNSMEDELSARERELIQSKKLAAIGTLASGVAHELNNPLNNIYTTAQRLIRKSDADCPAPIKKGLDDIFGQTMRVKRIVNDLLEFARGREPHFRTVELRALIRSVYANIGNTVDTSRIRFGLSLVPEEIVLTADPELLEQVFINLFTNAIEAMSGDGALTVNCTEEESSVAVMVADSGRGMSRENAEKIFEPFYTTKNKGTGLGLAIVYGIIQKHHGDISVESIEGTGTTFTILIPKHQAI